MFLRSVYHKVYFEVILSLYLSLALLLLFRICLGAMFTLHMSLPIILPRESSFFALLGVFATLYSTDVWSDLLVDVIVMSFHVFIGLEASSTDTTCDGMGM